MNKLLKFKQAFNEEMNMGLALNPTRKSTIQMENTYVPCLPDGTEEGDFLSLDLGSTNFRVLLSRLKPGEEGQFFVNYYDVPSDLRKGDANKVYINFINIILKILI